MRTGQWHFTWKIFFLRNYIIILRKYWKILLNDLIYQQNKCNLTHCVNQWMWLRQNEIQFCTSYFNDYLITVWHILFEIRCSWSIFTIPRMTPISTESVYLKWTTIAGQKWQQTGVPPSWSGLLSPILNWNSYLSCWMGKSSPESEFGLIVCLLFLLNIALFISVNFRDKHFHNISLSATIGSNLHIAHVQLSFQGFHVNFDAFKPLTQVHTTFQVCHHLVSLQSSLQSHNK